MRIWIMGAGAMGGFYGAMLAKHGHQVGLIARGAHLEALRARGLTVIRDEERYTVHPMLATDNPAEGAAHGVAELIVFATKAYDLENAATSLRPLVGETGGASEAGGKTLVLPLLNGVDHAERIGAILGREHLLGGLTYLPGNVPEPGVIHQPGPQNPMRFGELAGGTSARVTHLQRVFQEAGINSELSTDIETDLWTKFVLIIASAGACSIARQPVGVVAGDPELRGVFEALARETVVVGKALGHRLGEDSVTRAMTFLDQVPPRNKPSMLQDLERGKPLELAALHSTLVRMGREQGVPTPVNDLVQATLTLQQHGAF